MLNNFTPRSSVMTGKLKGLGAFNCSSLDNEFCRQMMVTPGTICHDGPCFSARMLQSSRQNCRPLWKRNGDWFATERSYSELKNIVIPPGYFRFDGHGELLSMAHARNYLYIAALNPQTKFALWTKRPELVQQALGERAKPTNLQLIYSSPYLNKIAKRPAGFDKVFTVFDSVPYGHRINCAGKRCIECRICYENNGIRTINEIVK